METAREERARRNGEGMTNDYGFGTTLKVP